MKQMDIQDVMEHLPHRYPFLLIDRVTDMAENEFLEGYKNITFNEPQFMGHFEGHPVFPGVLICEAMAQATGILAFRSMGGKPKEGELYILVGLDKVAFKKMVRPGDRLDMRVELKRQIRGLWIFEAKAMVDGELAAKAEIKCTAKAL